MVDVWNPNEGKNLPKGERDYYLINSSGKVLHIIRNDFGKAVKTAQRIINTTKDKVQIVPRKGE